MNFSPASPYRGRLSDGALRTLTERRLDARGDPDLSIPKYSATPVATRDRLGLRFTDPALERQFRAAHADLSRAVVRAGVVLVTLLFVLFAVVDVFWVPGVAAALAPLRIVLFALFGLHLAATYRRAWRLHLQRVTTSFVAVVMAGMVSIFVIAPDAVDFFGFMLSLIVVHTAFRLWFVPATGVAGGATAAYAACCLLLSPHPWTSFLYQFFYLFAANVLGMFASYSLEYFLRQNFLSQYLLARETERSEALLLNILPASIAGRLKDSTATIADHFAEVTVLFADLVGFTVLAGRLPVGEVVELLTRIFTEFDDLLTCHGVEKIKTIGDAYMAVAGLPEPRPDHAAAVADFALAMVKSMERLRHESGVELRVRVGIHSGPVVAGVLGTKKFLYDLWGDTVNVASRMESHGVPDRVQVSAETRRALGDGYAFGEMKRVAVKGKGDMETYLLLGRRE